MFFYDFSFLIFIFIYYFMISLFISKYIDKISLKYIYSLNIFHQQHNDYISIDKCYHELSPI